MKQGRIVGVAHLGVAVPDAATARTAFRAAFGLEPGAAESLPEHGVRTESVSLGRGVEIEFIEPLDPGNAIARYLARRGSGIHHLALEVEGLEALLETLRTRGVRLVDEHGRRGGGGTRVAFVHPQSTGGILVELVEHPGREQYRQD